MMARRLTRTFALVLLLWWQSVRASPLWADFTVVDANTPACPIVVAESAHPATLALAKKLVEYLERITSAEFALTHKATERCIELSVEPRAEMPSEGFSWRVTDHRVEILARTPRGLAYGVYDFLEQGCGCRWWSFNEEDVPRSSALILKNAEVIRWPPLLMHDLYNREAQTVENDFHFKSRGDSQLRFTGGHTLYPLLAEYGMTHPEIYPADAEGKRVPNDLHLCYLAPGLAEALTAALERVVNQHQGRVADLIYFGGMGDWYGGQCQCERCRAVYEEEAWTNPDGKRLPGYAGTLLRMINITAEQLERKYPGIQVGTFAYMSLEAPPAKTRPRANVVIRVPRLRHCTVHAALECDGNREFVHNLRRWQELAPGRVHVWDYGSNFTNFLLPFPSLNSMAENIRFYAELGVAGVMIQGNYVSTGGDAAVLKNYVWRKLMWEPRRSTQELIEEFCRGYYGPAAEPVMQYIATLENAVRQPALKHADEFASPATVYLNEALLAELEGYLREALQRAGGQEDGPYQRRVRELQVSVEAARLWREGPLEEQNGRLIRTDLGEDSYARALALVEHARRASPKEQGEGTTYRQQFLQWHGGPVATLASGDTTVKIAPLQAGRLGPIAVGGRTIVHETLVKPAGGALLYTFDKEPAKVEATLRGECGIGPWRPAPQHIDLQQWKLSAENELTLSGQLQAIQPGAAVAEVQVKTVYPVAEPNKVNLQWRTGEGDWQGAKLSAETPNIECAGLTCTKLTMSHAAEGDGYAVELLDSYRWPGAKAPVAATGTLRFDAKQKTLTVELKFTVAEIDAADPCAYLERSLQWRPFK